MGRLRIWLRDISPQFDRIESLYKLKDRDALAGYGVHGNSGGEGAAEHKTWLWRCRYR